MRSWPRVHRIGAGDCVQIIGWGVVLPRDLAGSEGFAYLFGNVARVLYKLFLRHPFGLGIGIGGKGRIIAASGERDD